MHIVPTSHMAVYQSAMTQSVFGLGGPQENLCYGAVNETDEMVGGIAFSLYASALFVQILWVSESMRGQGVGSRLLASAESYAIAHGCRQAIVETYSFYAPRFYLRRGYSEVGRVDGLGAHGRDARLSLTKPLAH